MADLVYINTVVRRFGSDMTHVVHVPTAALAAMAWPSQAYPFTAVICPVVARCGAQLLTYHGHDLTMMEEGTRVRCRVCKLLSGIEKQTDETYRPVHA